MAKKTMRDAFDEAVWTADPEGVLTATVEDPCEYVDDNGYGEFRARIFHADDEDGGLDIFVEHSSRGSALDGREYYLDSVEDAKAAVLEWLEEWEEGAERNIQERDERRERSRNA